MKPKRIHLGLLLLLLLSLVSQPLTALLAHEMQGGGLLISQGDTQALGGESVAGSLTLAHGSQTASVALTQADYQTTYEATDALLQIGRTFRNTEMLVVPSDTITQAMQNYKNFADGEYFERFCADYSQIDKQGYCPPGNPADWPGKSVNIRNHLRDALKGYSVLLTAPVSTTIVVEGQAVPVQEVGRQGILATIREMAYIHLIFGNEFFIDATDTRFSPGPSPPDATTIINQEIDELEQALEQFNLAMEIASYAFYMPLAGEVRHANIGSQRGGDYFTSDEFELFGVASDRTITTLMALAERQLKLGQQTQSLALYDQAYMLQYLHTQALAQMAQLVGAEHLLNGSWEIYNNMAETRNEAQRVRSGIDFFGFASDYVPLQSYEALREVVIGPSGDTGLLGTARNLEAEARALTREFDTKQEIITKELDDLIEEYEDGLFELCGEDPQRPGSGEPSLTQCEGGLVAQNWSDIFAADKRAGLALYQAANIAEQIKIEEERAQQVINVTLDLGTQISASELAIGKLEAFKFTGSSMASAETQVSYSLNAGMRNYTQIEAGFDSELTNWLTGGAKGSAIIGTELYVEQNIGFEQALGFVAETGTEWDTSALPIAQQNSIQALREAEANAQIEGANSEASIKNLLLQQSEMLIEAEIAMEELNKLLAEHNQLSANWTRLLNQRSVATAGVIKAEAHRNGPAYRVLADVLTAQAERAFDLAVQFAYLTAKAVEYDTVTPYPAIGEIYKARSTNDIYEFMNNLHAYYQAPVIENNPYPYTLSIAKDILGLSDQNIDPLGELTPEAREAIRYAEMQKFLRENLDEAGNLEFYFATSLDFRRSATQYFFSPNIWGNRIAGVGSPLAASQGIGINIRTRQLSDVGMPEVRLTHGGQASYRNPLGGLVYYDPGPAMPIGYELPPGLNPANISVVVRPGINGNSISRYAGLENLSVAASNWTFHIPYNSKGELDYSQIEDIEILIDSTGRALQNREAQAQRDAKRLQAGLELDPADTPLQPLPTLSPTIARPKAPDPLSVISNTYRTSILITSPLEIGVQKLGLNLINNESVLTGTVVPELSPMYAYPVALYGSVNGNHFILQSETLTMPVAGRNIQQSFRLEGQFKHNNDMLEAHYTAVITGYIASPIVIKGSLMGSRPLRVSGGMSLAVEPETLAVGGTTTVSTRLLFSKYPLTETNRITFTTVGGSITPAAVDMVDGLATATFTAGMVPGMAIITATNGLFTDSLSLEILSLDTPANLLVESAPSVVALNESAQITVTLLNALGQPMDKSDRITLTTNLGSITPASLNANNGVALATFTAGDTAGTAMITATNGTLVASGSVLVLEPDEAASLQITTSANTLTLGDSTVITASLFDFDGEPFTRPATLTFTSELGNINPPAISTTSGVATATFTAGMVPGMAIITASHNLLVNSTSLTLQAPPAETPTLYLPLILRAAP
jgi:hypothetical protein